MRPAIVGYGRTKFGEHYEKGPEDLMGEAGLKALDSAGLERRDIEYCFLSDYFLQLTNKIGIEEGFVSELLELHVPMERCRSFSSALFSAYHSIMAGRCEVALVGGVEKLTDRLDKVRDDLMMLQDPWSYYAGGSPEASHELMLRFYLKGHGLGEGEEVLEALALIAVKNHAWASLNQDAHFYGRRVTLEDVVEARKREARLLGLYDFAPISDGASAVILASPDRARELCEDPVYVRGFHLATDYISYPCREERAGFLATRLAVRRALSMARLGIEDVAVAELYDQSTLMELVTLEDAGFCPRGGAWKEVLESLGGGGRAYSLRGRELFVNTSGGRKGDGNPLGASGGAMIIELARQLRGEAGPRQIPLNGRPSAAMVVEMEGFGTKVYVHVLSKEEY